MCLNCLPNFEKCVFCISLKVAAILISLSGLICTICLIVLTCLNRTGLSSEGSINCSLWFICILLLWMITFIILLSVWTGSVQSETARDVLLQVYFWLSVVTGGIQLIFCGILFVTFWDVDLMIPIIYISATIKVFCDPKDAMKNLSILVISGICMMSCIFMFTGLMLLFGTLTDNDGFIQIFVWVTFLNVVFGYLLVIGVGYECMTKTSCILSKMDWLSGAAFLVFVTGYLSLWIYFISIANSYVMSVNV